MSEYSKAEVKAGAMIIVCLIALILGVIYVGPKINVSSNLKEEIIEFNDVGGLKIDSLVYYAGVPSGHVKAIKVIRNTPGAPPKIHVTVLIQKDVSFRKDDVIAVGSTLMGETYVQITAGFDTPLQAGTIVTGRDPLTLTGVVEQLETQIAKIDKLGTLETVDKIAKNIEKTTSKLNDMLYNNNDKIQNIINNIEDTTNDINALVENTGPQVNTIMENIDGTTKDIQSMVNSTKPQIDNILTQVKNAVANIDNIITSNKANIDQALSSVKDTALAVQKAAKGLEEILGDKEMQGDLKSLAGNLSETSELANKYLKDNEGNIKEIINNIKKGTSKLDETVLEAKKFLSLTSNTIESKQTDLGEIIENIRDTSASLKFFLLNLEENPWRLIRKPSTREITMSMAMVAAERFEIAAKRLNLSVLGLKDLANKDGATIKSNLEELQKYINDLKKSLEDVKTLEKKYDLKGTTIDKNRRP